MGLVKVANERNLACEWVCSVEASPRDCGLIVRKVKEPEEDGARMELSLKPVADAPAC